MVDTSQITGPTNIIAWKEGSKEQPKETQSAPFSDSKHATNSPLTSFIWGIMVCFNLGLIKIVNFSDPPQESPQLE